MLFSSSNHRFMEDTASKCYSAGAAKRQNGRLELQLDSSGRKGILTPWEIRGRLELECGWGWSPRRTSNPVPLLDRAANS